MVQLTNEFDVPAGPDEALAFLLDVDHVASCVPGAELTEVVDDRTWNGRLKVKLGPISLSFDGRVQLEEVDTRQRRVLMRAEGNESSGKGAARASVTSTLVPVDGVTRVTMVTDVSLSGPIAQYGRGIIQDVSGHLVAQFASCVAARMETGSESGDKARVEPAPAIGAFRLGLAALARAVGRFFRRILGRSK